MTQLLQALLVVALAFVVLVTVYWVAEVSVERLGGRRVMAFVYTGPALILVGLLLVYPALRTVLLSFQDRRSENWIGLANYEFLFTDSSMRVVLFNNGLWLLFVPTVSVVMGLLIAYGADKLSAKAEAIVKSLIFVPMAISFVGASTVWGFFYAWRPEGQPQIGLLNALWTAMGNEPVTWLTQPFINDFFLMAIMVWIQTGFAMVIFSAAIKSISPDMIEAARIDGASEVQTFLHVVIPGIRKTIAVVTTTIVILVLKVFDIIYVMTAGNYGTDVVARRFIGELFSSRDYGHAAAIVVVLMLVTVPFMVVNIRRYHESESAR